jgi:hypothetical protein
VDDKPCEPIVVQEIEKEYLCFVPFVSTLIQNRGELWGRRKFVTSRLESSTNGDEEFFGTVLATAFRDAFVVPGLLYGSPVEFFGIERSDLLGTFDLETALGEISGDFRLGEDADQRRKPFV